MHWRELAQALFVNIILCFYISLHFFPPNLEKYLLEVSTGRHQKVGEKVRARPTMGTAWLSSYSEILVAKGV